MKDGFAPLHAPCKGLALLVDGENISRALADTLRAKALIWGDPVVRRVYGEASRIKGWEDAGFRLVPNRPGKNAADLLLCVEAMVLALNGGFDTLVIASSDRDFSYLAEQLRELGHQIIGLGEAKAPAAFQRACTRFELLAAPARRAGPATPAPPAFAASAPTPAPVRDLLRQAMGSATSDQGWVRTSSLGSELRKINPAFSAKSHGHKTLTALITATRYFKSKTEPGGGVRWCDPHPEAAYPGTP